MIKLNENDKKNNCGGIGPMLLWTLMVGGCMIVDTISNLAHTWTESQSSGSYYGNYNSGHTSSNYDSFDKISVKVSPFPGKSGLFMNI
jgi:hypothetical protein